MYTEQELFDILRGFGSLQRVNSLKWPCNISFTRIHDFLLDSVLLNSHFLSYPPAIQYQRRFWKWAVENMERTLQETGPGSEALEIDERFYDRVLELLSGSGPSIGSSNPENRGQICGLGLPLIQEPLSDSFVTHYWQFAPKMGLNDTCVTRKLANISQYRTATLLESRRMIESGTTGLRTWSASLILAEHLARNPELTVGRRVLELGSGAGFLGIVVASIQLQYGAIPDDKNVGSLYLTDVNEEVLSRCRDNVLLPCNLSASHSSVHVQTLDWFSALDDTQRNSLISRLDNDIRPDIILGADIAFDPSLIPPLLAVLKLILESIRRRGNVVAQSNWAFLALPLRNQTTLDTFLTNAQDLGLNISQIPIVTDELASVNSPLDHTDVILFQIST